MYINQFSVVVFKRQHYVFHIFTGYTFVRQFPVLQFPPPEISLSVIFLSCKFSAPIDMYGLFSEATTSKVAAGKSLLPRVGRHRYAAVCDLKTRLARLGPDHGQPPHHDVVLADVQSWTAADVVDPDELAVGQRRRGLTE